MAARAGGDETALPPSKLTARVVMELAPHTHTELWAFRTHEHKQKLETFEKNFPYSNEEARVCPPHP